MSFLLAENALRGGCGAVAVADSSGGGGDPVADPALLEKALPAVGHRRPEKLQSQRPSSPLPHPSLLPKPDCAVKPLDDNCAWIPKIWGYLFGGPSNKD